MTTQQPIRISYEFVQEASQQPGVRQAVERVATRIARRAESIAASEGASLSVWVDSGTRPKGRPRSNVSADDAGQEFGTHGGVKRRILGRAADEAK